MRLKFQRLNRPNAEATYIEVASNEMGRPSTFSDQIFETICERLADGQPLSQSCCDPEMPDRETVKRWTRNDDDRRRQYDVPAKTGWAVMKPAVRAGARAEVNT